MRYICVVTLSTVLEHSRKEATHLYPCFHDHATSSYHASIPTASAMARKWHILSLALDKDLTTEVEYTEVDHKDSSNSIYATSPL
jgi:uncharacterized CHY-type Zn-finger protein